MHESRQKTRPQNPKTPKPQNPVASDFIPIYNINPKTMYSSKAMQAARKPNNFFQFTRMGFAAKEYDVAVIGGGPGGK